MALTLEAHRIHTVRLPYHRSLQWVNHAEEGLDLLLLVLETKEGLRGVGEAALRLNWTGATKATLPVVLEEIFLPRLEGVDLADSRAVLARLRGVPEHALAKSVIDAACWDLRAQAEEQPLWRRLGGSPTVRVSWTLTRAEPVVMAREAEDMRARHGFVTFKVKTGQGLPTDRAALDAIRRAAGFDIRLYADFNSACKPEEVEAATRMLADFGVGVAEDPCPLSPDSGFARIREASVVPILVDGSCRSVEQARLFIDAGAEAISVKVPKTGVTESLEIAAMARDAGVSVCIGLGATTSLGAVVALSLAGALPRGPMDFSCEETFFF